MKNLILSFTLIASLACVAFSIKKITRKDDFTGVWELVSIESIAKDSSITYPYGEKPLGLMMIDRAGNYMFEIYTTTRKKIAAGSKSSATAEENEMMVKGSNAHFGKFFANPDANTLLYQPQGAFFPNWEGLDLKSTYTYKNDLLKSFSSNTTFGGSKAIVTWQKKI